MSRAARIHYWQSEDGLWRFALVAGNGEPQAGGQGYKTLNGLMSGIEAARRNWRRAHAIRVPFAPSKAKP